MGRVLFAALDAGAVVGLFLLGVLFERRRHAPPASTYHVHLYSGENLPLRCVLSHADDPSGMETAEPDQGKRETD